MTLRAQPFISMCMSQHWYRIAHRGASGTAPEHTRTAFKQALACDVDMVELDVQMSRDQRLVVIHDTDLGRTTNGRGAVRAHDWEHIRSLDAGGWFGPEFAGQPPLCLEDVLDILLPHAQLNVEIKSPQEDWESLAQILTDVLRARDCFDSVVISCFETGALKAVRAQSDAAQLGVLWYLPEVENAWHIARELRAVSFHPYWGLVSHELTQTARENSLKVFTWTVNEEEMMQHLLRLGVDGIISDFPDRFAALESGCLEEGEIE